MTSDYEIVTESGNPSTILYAEANCFTVGKKYPLVVLIKTDNGDIIGNYDYSGNPMLPTMEKLQLKRIIVWRDPEVTVNDKNLVKINLYDNDGTKHSLPLIDMTNARVLTRCLCNAVGTTVI